MLTLPLGHALLCHCNSISCQKQRERSGYHYMKKRILAISVLLYCCPRLLSGLYFQLRGSQLDEEFVSELIDRY
jgi:hypothetical protein